MKIIEKEINIQTGEEIMTERDETKEETKARLDAEKAATDYAEAKAQQEAKKAALLTRLGITDEEAKLLLS